MVRGSQLLLLLISSFWKRLAMYRVL